MANTRAANVIRVDTTAAIQSAGNIRAILYIGNTSGTAVIRKDDASGAQMWQRSGTGEVSDEVYIRSAGPIHVTVTNGAVIYIYSM